MDNRSAKKVAASMGCDLWYDTQIGLWCLHETDALEIEGTGGQYIPPSVLHDMSKEELTEACEAATEGRQS